MDDVIQDEDEDSTVESKHGERAQFRNELLKDINSDLSTFGMKVVSVSLQKIWDTSNYIANLAQRTLAQKRQQVEIEEARLRALAEKAESNEKRRSEVSKSVADEKILTAREKVEVFRRGSIASIEKARLDAEHSIKEALNIGERDVQEQLVELQKYKNESTVILEAAAKEKAAIILAEGEQQSVGIIEETRNDILQQKVKMLSDAGDTGRVVLFIQQQLPNLFEAYKKNAQGTQVDSLLVMDDEKGFNGAVNRGPSAFVDFLKHFENALGVDVHSIVSPEEVN
jgi:regulator of protease activity HflC (stomatin/prohibitin superfamily)